MHGVAFRQADNSAKHCPFSITPTTLSRKMYRHLRQVTPLLAKLIHRVSEDHDFLQTRLSKMAKAEPFFGRLLALHQQAHGALGQRQALARKPLLLLRTDYMDDRKLGAKVIEFNGIAAGMAPFGQRATELHHYIKRQWPSVYQQWAENPHASPADNQGLIHMAAGIAQAANRIQSHFDPNAEQAPTFLMVVQENEDNVYDQHLLEDALQQLGIRTVRRTFEQLSKELYSGEQQRLLLAGVGTIDVVYLRAGYQYQDYYSPHREEQVCCQALSQTRLFIEQHYVAVNATFSQQLATSKTMQMLLTKLPVTDFARWGLTVTEANLVKSVLADMQPVSAATIDWFNRVADHSQWVLKNQGEGGGHCVFGDAISHTLSQLKEQEYDAWALMQRLQPRTRTTPAIAVRDNQASEVSHLVSEIGLFTVFFEGQPMTELDGYAGYLIRSKPAAENEGGIHSGQGILDSLVLVD
ncbi:glutathione synthase [Motilimonas pumila]|uniref:glutathione synthase n=2 Tax=Motilimonas pumila TaxID=2303987 RepID=A0A418YES7_9GAMM|nr:glutathione synthase [Motilimonas pumila]